MEEKERKRKRKEWNRGRAGNREEEMGRKKKASVAETEGKKGREDHKAGILKTLFKKHWRGSEILERSCKILEYL